MTGEGPARPHHFPVENRQILLSEERRQTNPPERALDLLPLREDAAVADIGCGPGYYALPLAERLPKGVVYAVDIEPLMLRDTRERAAAAGIRNIEIVQAEPGAVPLPPASLDGAFMGFSYHEIADRADYLRLLNPLFRPGGWLAVMEWEKKQNPGGGPPLWSRLTPEEVRGELEAAGWRIAAQHALSEWHYLLLARLAG